MINSILYIFGLLNLFDESDTMFYVIRDGVGVNQDNGVDESRFTAHRALRVSCKVTCQP